MNVAHLSASMVEVSGQSSTDSYDKAPPQFPRSFCFLRTGAIPLLIQARTDGAVSNKDGLMFPTPFLMPQLLQSHTAAVVHAASFSLQDYGS
jgi:hypothetical protein